MVEKQNMFLLMIAKLINKANELGYKVSAGEFGRPEEIAKIYSAQGKGISNSLHISRLAADLNVFRNGKWLTDGAEYEDLGKYWESLGGSWGQRFLDSKGKPKPDGNHFSLSHNGVK